MSAAASDFSAPVDFPSLLGVYLAVNAVRDLYVLVDGPDCALYKAHFLHGRHDWGSTLLRVDGKHRVAFTNVCARGVVREHDAVVAGCALDIDGLASSGGQLVTAMPLCSITGVDYGRVLRGLGARLTKPAADIPPGSLVGDWLDGYAQALCALARAVDLPEGRRRPGTAAVVGYLWDRSEGDHEANVAQLRALLAAAGLELVSTWLDGGPWSELSKAAQAEIVFSLPYGRRAARIVAERTGASLIDADLPFGLGPSAAFARLAAEAAGAPGAADAFIERELARAARRLQWVLPQLFVGRSTVFVGDPYLLEGYAGLCRDAGLELAGAVVTHPSGPSLGETPVLCAPPCESEAVQELICEPEHLLVTCWFPEWRLRRPLVAEFGFPSYRQHALYDRPFLGFGGCLAFLDRLAEVLGREDDG